jgi:hypothetical protein
MAAELAAGPTFAHGMTKTMLQQEWAMTIEQAIEAEAQAQAICMQTQDFTARLRGLRGQAEAGVWRGLSMTPSAHLGLPFFDDAHRDWPRLAAWARSRQVDERDDRAACREWVRRCWAMPAGCATACRPRMAARCPRSTRARW